MAGKITEVRDPVHGFIYLNETEIKIVNSPPFQRLRYIRQLALTYLVYPGAEHSRFAHSLGVMEFSTRIFDALMAKQVDDLKWKPERVKRNRQLLRLASLMHDLGHAPFSHASEGLLKANSHEEISKQFMVTDPIASYINEFKQELGITAEEVGDFFSADNLDPDIAFLKEIFAGEIDADKLDYLYRDSLFTGVLYGRFDYHRLIQSLCLIQPPESKVGNYIIAVEHGGLHALEAMVLARYFMFTQVYFHKTRRAYDWHLVEFLKKFVGSYPTALDEYLQCDDNYVYSLLRQNKTDENADRILNRRPFSQAFTTPEHINEEERTRFAWLQETIERDLKDFKFFFDAAEKSPHKFEKIGVYVINSSTGKPSLVINESGIIRNLKKIEQHRVFTEKEKKEEVGKFCTDFWNKKAGMTATKG